MGSRPTYLKIATTAAICIVAAALANVVRLQFGIGTHAGFLIAAIAAAFCIARLRYRFLVSTVLAACGGAMACWQAALLLPVLHRWSPLDDGRSFLQSEFLGYGAVAGVVTALICEFWWRRQRYQQAVKPFRFSTCQMAIAVTIFSILLAGATARIHQRQRAEELAKAWNPLGVSLTFDYCYRPKSAWTANNNQVDDGALAELTQLTTLRSLNLYASNITDAGLTHVANLPSLKHLMIGGLPISDAGLANLSVSRSLREVDLFMTKVTSDGVLELCEQTNLNHVRIQASLAELVNANHRPPPSVGETKIAFNY